MTDPVFVFGSNLAGRHGKGAALEAVKKYGAKRGIAEGMAGNSYAIPTKDEAMRSLSLGDIEFFLVRFLGFAEMNPQMAFLLTPIGCGLAGYSRREIWTILSRHVVPSNVYLASSWIVQS